MKYAGNSSFEYLKAEDGNEVEIGHHPESVIKDEPMFFNSTIDFAREHGSVITKEFIQKLPQEYQKNGIFDSRVHMLQPQYYPAIPGWHHDDIQRSRADGQPNYAEPGNTEHILALVNGDISPTMFAVGQFDLEVPPEGNKIYKVWHHEIERLIRTGALIEEGVKSNRLVQFDKDAFHKATAATKFGWRWFGRVTINSTRKATNEIRKQVQVYLSDINEGW